MTTVIAPSRGKTTTFELLGGKGPDIWRIWGGQIGAPFVKAKQAMDLAPYYQKFGWDSKINTAAIEGMTFDGVKGGVPFVALGIGAWYNKALFAKAKVDIPKSYAELEQANDKLVAAGIVPLGTGGKYGWHIMRLYEYLLEQAQGGAVLAVGTSFDALRARVADDPFVAHEVVEAEIVQITPSRTSPLLQELLAATRKSGACA